MQHLKRPTRLALFIREVNDALTENINWYYCCDCVILTVHQFVVWRLPLSSFMGIYA